MLSTTNIYAEIKLSICIFDACNTLFTYSKQHYQDCMTNATKHLIFFMLNGIIAFSCSSNQNQAVIQQQVPGTYEGTLPCADCEGIQFQLVLRDDEHYQSSSIYLGKNETPFIDSGTWSIADDSVVVLGDQHTDSQQSFVVETNGTLRMLDQKRNMITGPLADLYVLRRAQPEDTLPAINTYRNKRRSGIDFMAMGNEPGWTLDVDFDSLMYFKSINGDSISFPVPDAEEDGKKQTFEAETEDGSFKISITEEPCSDDMSGEDFTHIVSVVTDKQEFQGCGRYITHNEMAYEGQWTLTGINGDDFSATGNQETPMLNMQSKDHTVNGTTGCNRLSGKFEVAGDSISFNKLITTKRACEGKTEQHFLKALEKVNTYKVENEQLILMDDEEKVLVFEKVSGA